MQIALLNHLSYRRKFARKPKEASVNLVRRSAELKGTRLQKPTSAILLARLHTFLKRTTIAVITKQAAFIEY